MLKLNNNLAGNKQGFIMICLAIFIVMFVVGIIFMIWFIFFGGAQAIANICLLFTIPLILIVICAVLAKKYLLKGGKK